MWYMASIKIIYYIISGLAPFQVQALRYYVMMYLPSMVEVYGF